ncbi:MAG: phosphotyrosine protein phosphatase [Rhodospirillaceae bacterium]|nr:phosphotyrosine protein phosphatase [Rhodospirillaceae bacterium]
MNVLFVCTANKLRSPTAEAVFSGREGVAVRSAGLDPAAPRRLTEELVAWADRIYAMEDRHRQKIRKKFRKALGAKPMVTLHIPDEYEFMQPELISLLTERLPDLGG